MPVSESALVLGGFVLAHACLSIADTHGSLVPLAIVERNSRRQALRFVAKTQIEAIAQAKERLASMTDADAWAFAREGLINEGGQKVDVLSVEIWGRGSLDRVTVMQRFEPFAARNHFNLIGVPKLIVNGALQSLSESRTVLDAIDRGVMQHSKVAPLWAGWHAS